MAAAAIEADRTAEVATTVPVVTTRVPVPRWRQPRPGMVGRH